MADGRSTLQFLLLFLVFLSAFGKRFPSSSFTERAALLNLRSSLGIRARDWPRKSDPCLVWAGVQCGQDGRVVGIDLSGLRRTRLGRLNPQFTVDALSNFTFLAYFNASGFSLPGFLPDLFGQRLSSLQLLDLRFCSVVGPVPSSLGNLTNLNLLNLSSNRLTGLIPSTLGQLLRLSILDLSQNSFTGSIPTSFSNLPNLTRLDLSSNFLYGSIPSAIGTLSNLQLLNLSSNSLSSVPVQLGHLSRLVDLDLGFNSLSGSLPPDLFSNLTQLQFVVLTRNSLSDTLPDSLWSMPELSFLDISHNNFTGALPNVSLNSNVTVAMLNLSHNQFYGNLTAQFKRFSIIDISYNYFQGKVPNDIRSNASLSSNCLQNVSNQRTLQDCTSFYAERDLTFDNFGVPNTTQPSAPGPVQKSNRRLIFILAAVFVGLLFIVLLVVSLALCLSRRESDAAEQHGRAVELAPAGSPRLGRFRDRE